MKAPHLLLPLLALSCVTPGSQPHAMSAEKHVATAKEMDAAASSEAAQYNETATQTRQRCAPFAETRADVTLEPCWTSLSNPTDEHRRLAEQHRRHAADHRAASVALREAEAQACVGLDADDRDISPLERTEDIAGATPLEVSVNRGKIPTRVLAGAVVTFRAVPGMTAEWLQRVVDCHLARNASLGHVVPEMPNCPLVPRGVRATVSSAGSAFAISVQSDDPDVAQEVLARARH